MKAYFLGSSGKDGFFSCFEQLMPKTEGRYIYIIKGGPGTGKSSFMKKIADEMESKDIDCERIFCSSDPDSLDGVIFPSLRVSIADGTSPHVLDPDYPGASGEIINFGDCWNKTLLREREKQIMTMRFGLFGSKEYTQKQVADLLGISQSYISRLEKRIIEKIKTELQKAM